MDLAGGLKLVRRIGVGVLVFLFNLFIIEGWTAFVNLDKVKIRITTPPGTTEAGIITVENRENHPIFVKVYPMEWRYIQPFDGAKEFYPMGTLYKGVEKWFRYSPQELQLAPGERALVHYKVNLPENIDSPCYLVLFFETELGGSEAVKGEKRVGLQLLTRIGTLFLIEPKGVVFRKAELVGATVSGKGVSLKINNLGNTALIGKIRVFVLDDKDMMLGKSETVDVYAPPKTKFDFFVPLSSSGFFGAKKLLVTLQEETGKVYSWEYNL